MIIRDALQGVAQIGIDTASLIYFVEKHPVYFDRMVTIVQHITQGSLAGISAALTLTEVLTLLKIPLVNWKAPQSYND